MPDINPFSINPCLFIGIGTNGWRILDELRRLIYEEFGRGGLPCFRYVGIETNSGKRPDDSFLPHALQDYEKVSPVYISISDKNVITSRLDPNSGNRHIPGLGEWLDLNLIQRGARSFDSGAGSSRQAGRMCLWENWDQFKQAVDSGLGWLSNPNNRRETEEFLRDEYFGKKRRGIQPPADSLINPDPKVYIFGTLCGGTCSGTFIDIAYYVSDKIGLLSNQRRAIQRGAKDPEVIGMFTIAHRALVHDDKHHKYVANSWSALKELDFYCQAKSRYTVTMPDGSKFDTDTEPFSTVYIESLRNMANMGFESADYDGLAQMCAMNLFTEVVAGLAAIKNASRVDLREHAEGYLQPNLRGYMRAFSSFGLSAFWYPKYRIAQAINRQLALEMCDGWLGGEVKPNPVREEAARNWETFLTEARSHLVGSAPNAHCGLNLPAIIGEIFDKRESEFLAEDESNLESSLVNFPNSQSTFVSRLSGPTGEYFDQMRNAEPFVVRDLKTAVTTAVNRHFREHTCAETKEFAASLTGLATQTIEQLRADPPALSQQIEVGLARDVHQGWWAKSLGLHAESVAEYRRSLWHALRQRVLSHVDRLRDYFLCQALMKLQGELVNVQNQVSQAEARLRVFRGKCEREMRELIDLKPPGNIVILAAGEKNTVAEDVELGSRQVLRNTNRDTLKRLFIAETEPLQWLTSEMDKRLSSQIDLAFSPFSQGVTADFQIGQKAAGSRTMIPELVNRAAPYIEPVAAYRPLKSNKIPNFLFCADEEARRKLVDEVNNTLEDERYSPAASTLDHFVIFYHEAVGVALSDLSICDDANESVEKLEKNPNRVSTNYTHKLGEKMFDIKLINGLYATSEWIKAMKYLSPESFKTVGPDLCLDYKSADGLPRLLQVDNPQALRGYIETQGVDSLTANFIEQLNKLGRDTVLSRMTAAFNKAPSMAEKNALTKMHEDILKAAFRQTN